MHRGIYSLARAELGAVTMFENGNDLSYEIISIEAVDLFRGKNVPSGKYSLLVRATFQSREATLTEGQINHFVEKIISILEHRHNAQLRAS